LRKVFFVNTQLSLKSFYFSKKKLTKKTFLKKRKRKLFYTFAKTKKKIKTWDRIKNYYKKGLLSKTFVDQTFDNSILFTSLKKKLKKKDLSKIHFVKNHFLHYFFRIDILLFRLNCFSSPFEARQSLNNGEILLNGKSICGNIFLKKGDVLFFKCLKLKKNLTFKKLFLKQSRFKPFLAFVEIDFYTKTFVVFKDLSDLTEKDIFFLFSSSFDFRSLKNYL
jgi:ribosomal protein S4